MSREFKDNYQRMVLTRRDDFNVAVTVQDNSGRIDEPFEVTIDRVAAHDLVEAIHAEMGWDRPGEVVQSAAEQINSGELKVDGPADAAESAVEEPTAEEAHQHLSEHWDRRMDVVQRALTMLPAPGKRGGLAAAFNGEEIEQPERVEKALKIARFAADEHREIPGVDR